MQKIAVRIESFINQSIIVFDKWAIFVLIVTATVNSIDILKIHRDNTRGRHKNLNFVTVLKIFLFDPNDFKVILYLI